MRPGARPGNPTGPVAKRKSDKRHGNPGRPRSGNTDVRHDVQISAEADKLIRHSAEAEGISLAEWWRRAVGAGLLRSVAAAADRQG